MEHLTEVIRMPEELEPLAREMRKYKVWRDFEKIMIPDEKFEPHPEWLRFLDILQKIPTKEILGKDISRELLASQKLNEILRPIGRYRFVDLKQFWEVAQKKGQDA